MAAQAASDSNQARYRDHRAIASLLVTVTQVPTGQDAVCAAFTGRSLRDHLPNTGPNQQHTMLGYSQLATILILRIRAFRVGIDDNTQQRQHIALQAKAQVHWQLSVLSQTVFAISRNQLISREQLIKADPVSLVMVGPSCS